MQMQMDELAMAVRGGLGQLQVQQVEFEGTPAHHVADASSAGFVSYLIMAVDIFRFF